MCIYSYGKRRKMCRNGKVKNKMGDLTWYYAFMALGRLYVIR